MIAYRADIDGLRAVAVLLVVLFHLELFSVTGGYVGVDVFFVISGYLISAILLKDLKNGKLSLWHFYERRVRRILPAMFFIMLVVTIAAVVFLFPQEFKYFGETLAATAAYGSNILFWQESGYFEVESQLVPLLHTWSLGVEEQFYILFPLFLIVLYRYARRWAFAGVVAAMLVSFAIAVVGLEARKYAAVFYLLPPRAWELMIGAVLAFHFIPVVKNRSVNSFLAALGVLMIVAAGFVFREKTPFPGVNALLPTVGAALVIYAGFAETNVIGRLLGARMPVMIGKMSYSLYLWHWPLVVFYSYVSPQPLDQVSGLIILGVSLVLSYLTWRFVESPFRQQARFSRKTIFTFAALGSLFFIAVGLGISYAKGVPERFPEDVQKISAAKIGGQLPRIRDMGFEGSSGILGQDSGDFSFVVWGDSHAKAAIPALDSQAKKYNMRGYLFEDSGCLPGLGALDFMEDACNEFNVRVLDYLRDHDNIEHVILIARWDAYEKRFERHDDISQHGYYKRMRVLMETLEGFGKRVSFVMQVPALPVANVPLYLARATYYGQEADIDMRTETYFHQQKKVSAVLERLKSEGYRFDVLELYKALCDEKQCMFKHDGRVLYYDDDHLSRYGAQYVQNAFAPLFAAR